MADLEDRDYPVTFKGLLTDAEVSLGVMAVGTLIFEILSRWKRPTRRKDGQTTAEDLSMAGYLYKARTFVPHHPSPQHPKWPLLWIWQVLWLDESFYVQHTSIDAATYVRVLRGAFYFTLSQTLTTFPVLLSIHIYYSPQKYEKKDMNRASLSALVSNRDNVHLLWVHTLLLWFLTLCWWVTCWWVGKGVINMRNRHLCDMAATTATSAHDKSASMSVQGNTRGIRHLTVLCTNIPKDLRTESALVDYFCNILTTDDDPSLNSVRPLPQPAKCATHNLDMASGTVQQGERPRAVTRVVLVRRTTSAHVKFRQREEALEGLEQAHIQLACNVLSAVKAYNRCRAKGAPATEKVADAQLELLSTVLTPYLDNSGSEKTHKAIWEALSNLPASALDAYQPMYSFKHLFKGQQVPAIDYYLARYNLMTALLNDLRRSPEEHFGVAPIAFVTFERAKDARRVLSKAPMHPRRYFACILSPGPDVRDIVWDKLVVTTFRGDVVRSVLVEGFTWLFIIFYIIPVSGILAIVSITNIADKWPALERYLRRHTTTNALLTSLIPTLLLSILLFLVPTLLIQLANRGQHFFLVSRLHRAVLARFWKFQITDVLILFCVGRAAIESLFTDPGSLLAPSSLLNKIAAAFPAGATFFVGWQILVCGLHPFFELMLLGFPWINHISVSKAKTPRKRFELALPRSINVYYTLPNHICVLSVVFIFALLNPLVICFNLVYFALTLVIFKRSFGFYYWTRNYQLNGKLVYVRFLRYSLDALMVGQVAIIALFFVARVPQYGGACIPALILTAGFKLLLTRVFKAYSDALDVQEADIVTGVPLSDDTKEVVTIPLLPAFLTRIPFFARLSWPVNLQPLSAKDIYPPLAEKQPVSEMPSEQLQEAEEQGHAEQPLVVPHPPLQRDDRADFDAQYDNPYINQPLLNQLWLPRDPLGVIDLNDTVDYHGRALVSSAVSDGRLGSSAEDDAMLQTADMVETSFDPSCIMERSQSAMSTTTATSLLTDGRHRTSRLSGKEQTPMTLLSPDRIDVESVNSGTRPSPRRPSALTLRRRSSAASTSMGPGWTEEGQAQQVSQSEAIREELLTELQQDAGSAEPAMDQDVQDPNKASFLDRLLHKSTLLVDGV